MGFSGPAEERVRRHRALGDPSRARILDELAAAGPLDARGVAERVGRHVNTVRVHLNALSEVGLVERETLAPTGPGRPRVVYHAAGGAADEEGRRYRLLAEILTALVARLGPDAATGLVETGASFGRYLVDAPPPYVALSEGETVGRLVDLLRDVGFEPTVERDVGGGRILMRPCPFLELASEHQDVVCSIHLGLMQGSLDALGAASSVATLEPFVRPDLCVATLGGGQGTRARERAAA